MSSNWDEVVATTVPQYPLKSYGNLAILSKAEDDELVVAGYASPQVVDRQGHVILKEALARDLPRFMAIPNYRNAMLTHTNVQVAEIIPFYVDTESGKRWETKVDEIGLFTVAKIRTDKYKPQIQDKVIEDIRIGKLGAFSISVDAPFESRRHECVDGVCFWIMEEVEIFEVTICEKPVNQDAMFSIISKAMPDDEFAASAFCKDGTCLLKSDLIAAGVAVVARDTNRVLMLQRALTDDDPASGTWEFPGGHVEEGEDPQAAGKREWEEEIGVVLPYGKWLGSWDSSNGIYRGFIYQIEEEATVNIGTDRDEVTNPDDPDGDWLEAIAWWDTDHLEDNPALRQELRNDMGLVLAALEGLQKAMLSQEVEEKLETTLMDPLTRQPVQIVDSSQTDPKLFVPGEDDEYQYLNQSSRADSFEGKEFELVEAWRDGLDKALSSLTLRGQLLADTRAVLAAIQTEGVPALTRLDKTDIAVWIDESPFSSLGGFVPTAALFKELRREASAQKQGKLANEFGLLSTRIARADPLGPEEARLKAQKLFFDIKSITEPIEWEGTTSLLKSESLDPVSLIKSITDRLEMAVDITDPVLLGAIASLSETAEAILDGIALGDYIQSDEPEHEIIEASGANDTYEDVAEATALLDKVNKSAHPGAMIAWFPNSGQANQWAIPGGEPAEDLHITIAYLTDDCTDWSEEKIAAVGVVMNGLANEAPPLLGQLSGIGHFFGEKKVLVALADVPELFGLRAKLLQGLSSFAGVEPPNTHGFTPHMTLQFDPPGVDTLESRGIAMSETTPIVMDKLWFVHNGIREEFDLDSGVGQISGGLSISSVPATSSVRLTKGDTTIEIT